EPEDRSCNYEVPASKGDPHEVRNFGLHRSDRPMGCVVRHFAIVVGGHGIHSEVCITPWLRGVPLVLLVCISRTLPGLRELDAAGSSSLIAPEKSGNRLA